MGKNGVVDCPEVLPVDSLGPCCGATFGCTDTESAAGWGGKGIGTKQASRQPIATYFADLPYYHSFQERESRDNCGACIIKF